MGSSTAPRPLGTRRSLFLPVSSPVTHTCLQCGTVATRAAARMCRRCGIPFGEAPTASARLASCPVCYRDTDADGRLPSLAHPSRRLDINEHIDEHERFPVGDDAWLETMRRVDRIGSAAGRRPSTSSAGTWPPGWSTRGRNRLALHNALVTAMTQVQRWGPGARVIEPAGGVGGRAGDPAVEILRWSATTGAGWSAPPAWIRPRWGRDRHHTPDVPTGRRFTCGPNSRMIVGAPCTAGIWPRRPRWVILRRPA